MRTCTVMIYTDGTNTRYAIMRGKMKGKSFLTHSAEIIGEFKTSTRRCEESLYRELTALYATAEAPAVYWQA